MPGALPPNTPGAPGTIWVTRVARPETLADRLPYANIVLELGVGGDLHRHILLSLVNWFKPADQDPWKPRSGSSRWPSRSPRAWPRRKPGVYLAQVYRGSLMHRMPSGVLTSGPLFGLAVWVLGLGVVAPQLDITQPRQRGTWRETATNLAAHLVYGSATALVAHELQRQGDRRDAGLRAVRWRVG